MNHPSLSNDRRRFICTTAMPIAASQLGLFRSADAQSTLTKPVNVPVINPGTNTSLGSLKQIDPGVLNVGYAEAGPIDGPVVLLLRG